MNSVIIICLIMVLLFILILLYIFEQFNKLVKLKNKVKQSKSGIEVYLQQRFDLIPNIVKIVNEYAAYEKKVLENLVILRTDYDKTKEIKIGEELNKKINIVIANAENYPQLKASEQFLNLQKNLEKIESQLQAARRIYNMDVTNYNIKINVIPNIIIAKLFGFKEEPLFEVENENVRNNIKI